MPERIRFLLEKYGSANVRDAMTRFTARDNTAVAGNGSRGYVPAEERPIQDRSEARLDDGPMGFVPVVGDVLQGGQAVHDFFNGDYGKAALGAGMLFVPNTLEKTAKPFVRQLLKNGTERWLRHAPARTIDYGDALLRPYKGQNFIHHGISDEYVRDVLDGETRVMSPSLAINRWGDYNEAYTPGFYGGNYLFLGDRSMLDNSAVFRGDGYTPVLGDVWYGSAPVPGNMRESVAEDMWQRMARENVSRNRMDDLDELNRLPLPADGYFEAKYHGTYPLEGFRYGIFKEPTNRVEERIMNEFDKRGLPIRTFDGTYENKVETLLNVLNENPDILFKCGGKKYPGGGRFIRTKLTKESPMMYEPMMPVYHDVSVPERYYPQPNLGDYEYPTSTGMVQSMPIQTGYVAPVPETGVLQEEALVPVEIPTLDARKDAARRIMAVENSKANANGGWDAKTGRWYPHKSHEGGADTIAYGIKLSNGTPEAKLALKQGYLTDQQAEHFVDTLVNRYYDAAKKVYDKKYGEGEWDKLSDKSQSILVDYSYNPGLAKFPKLMEGFHSGNIDLIRQNYKRYVNGKELGRNKTLLEEIDTLGNEYSIFRADGGKLYKRGGEKKEKKDFSTWQKLLGVPRLIEKYSHGAIPKDKAAALVHNPGGWAKELFSPEQIEEIRQNLYDNFLPFGYTTEILKQAGDAAFAKESNIHDPDRYKKAVRFNYSSYGDIKNPGIRDEMFALYLNPKRKRYHPYTFLKETGYRPTRGTTYDRVYGFNRDENPYFEKNLVDSYFSAKNGKDYYVTDPQGEKGSVYRTFEKGKSDDSYVARAAGYGFLGYGSGDPSDNAGDWTLSSGVDPNRGQYVSFYDDYDLNPSANSGRYRSSWFGAFPVKTQDASGGIGSPFTIYDRVYLDDYFGVNSRPQNPDEYYGGYLVPSVISSEKASGGKIHIAPSKRGTFTAAAKKHGKSVQAFASQVLAHKENYSPAMVKKANFARNAAKWHGEGGILERYDADSIREAIRSIRSRQK